MPAPDTAVLSSSGWRHTSCLTPTEPGRIDLYLFLSADYQSCTDALVQRLSAREQQQAMRKKIIHKRLEYVLGQAALRCLLANALSIPGTEVCYVRGPKGKPALALQHTRPDLHFNISHSNGIILVALSRAGAIGIDIEAINPHTSIDLVSRRAFSQCETEALQTLPQALQRQHFFQLWTCKEAVVKCSGDGIHSGMNQFSVLFSNVDEARISEATGPQAKTSSYSLALLNLGPTHKGALACTHNIGNLRQHYLNTLPG